MTPKIQNNSAETKDETKSNTKPKMKALPEKKFELRNSVLTVLFENNPHIKTIYHIFIASLICLFVNTVAHDYFLKGEIKLGVYLIYLSFGKLHIAILAWIAFLSLACCCYMCFNIWACQRKNFLPKSIRLKVWDYFWLASFIGYYVLSFRLSSAIVTTFRLPPASAAIVLLEQVRFSMKNHAFVRSTAGNVLKYKPHSDKDLHVPPFSKFTYFLFAPTLIYRDEYPRTKKIRWDFVICRSTEIAGVIFYQSFIFDRFLLPIYKDFGLRKFTWNEIIVSTLENSILGLLIFVTGFYLLLHAVQNLFAELLCFGDRMFYKDWWNSVAISEYFRTWNVVVHDWLYTYIYKDIYETVISNQIVAKLSVFILSAIVHEWALTYMFGFFFPLLFFEFLLSGGLFSFIKVPQIRALNVLFWYGLALGNGMLVSMYTIEYFARTNLPGENFTLKDYVFPKLLTADCIEYQFRGNT